MSDAIVDALRAELGDTPEGHELARVLAAWSGESPFPLLLEASR